MMFLSRHVVLRIGGDVVNVVGIDAEVVELFSRSFAEAEESVTPRCRALTLTFMLSVRVEGSRPWQSSAQVLSIQSRRGYAVVRATGEPRNTPVRTDSAPRRVLRRRCHPGQAQVILGKLLIFNK